MGFLDDEWEAYEIIIWLWEFIFFDSFFNFKLPLF